MRILGTRALSIYHKDLEHVCLLLSIMIVDVARIDTEAFSSHIYVLVALPRYLSLSFLSVTHTLKYLLRAAKCIKIFLQRWNRGFSFGYGIQRLTIGAVLSFIFSLLRFILFVSYP